MTTSTIQQTIEQKRAASAWNAVSKFLEHHSTLKNNHREPDSIAKKYKGLVKSAPADVQTNGLGQAVAFWLAKRGIKQDDQFAALYAHLSEWMKSAVTNDKDLKMWIIDAGTSSVDYRRATVEALTYLGWLKRFAEATIEGAPEEE